MIMVGTKRTVAQNATPLVPNVLEDSQPNVKPVPRNSSSARPHVLLNAQLELTLITKTVSPVKLAALLVLPPRPVNLVLKDTNS